MLYSISHFRVINGNIELGNNRRIMVENGISEIAAGMHRDLTIRKIGRGLRIERRKDARLFAIFTGDEILYYGTDKKLLTAEIDRGILYERAIEGYYRQVVLVIEASGEGFYYPIGGKFVYRTDGNCVDEVDFDAMMCCEEELPFETKKVYVWSEFGDEDDYEEYTVTGDWTMQPTYRDWQRIA